MPRTRSRARPAAVVALAVAFMPAAAAVAAAEPILGGIRRPFDYDNSVTGPDRIRPRQPFALERSLRRDDVPSGPRDLGVSDDVRAAVGRLGDGPGRPADRRAVPDTTPPQRVIEPRPTLTSRGPDDAGTGSRDVIEWVLESSRRSVEFGRARSFERSDPFDR